MTGGEVTIKISNLSKRFGNVEAVKDLNLEFCKGEIFGFLGPNGAGKTTTINMICGLHKPDAGEIHFNGDLHSVPRARKYQTIGLCPQELVIWDYMTCREQLLFCARMYGMDSNEAKKSTDHLIDELGLKEKRNKQARTLSGGMKRRLNFALALVHQPEIVILDEPEAGLDPQSRVMVRDFIRTLSKEKTVIFTTHNMDEAERICDRVGIIDHGEMLVIGTSEELKQSAGEGDILEITLDSKIDEIKINVRLEKLLGKKLKNMSLLEDRLIINVTDGATVLPKVLSVLKEMEAEIKDIRFRWSTLEDLFIKLTGRSLRQ